MNNLHVRPHAGVKERLFAIVAWLPIYIAIVVTLTFIVILFSGPLIDCIGKN